MGSNLPEGARLTQIWKKNISAVYVFIISDGKWKSYVQMWR